jgi:hypothetical protein
MSNIIWIALLFLLFAFVGFVIFLIIAAVKVRKFFRFVETVVTRNFEQQLDIERLVGEVHLRICSSGYHLVRDRKPKATITQGMPLPIDDKDGE